MLLQGTFPTVGKIRMKNWLYKVDRIDVMPRPGGIDLRYSEWTEPLPPKLFNKFIETLTWDDFALYPDTNLLKDKLAEHHKVTPLNIYLGPGSAECISNVFECLAERQSITTTEPCFPMYDVYAAQCNLLVNKVYPNTDLTYNARQLMGGNLIVLSRPSNPVGYFFTRKDIITILEQNSDRWVLVDEVYIEYAENKDNIIDLITKYDNLIVSRSFSKTFGAAGCRVGYLISNSINIDLISKLRPMYEITGPSQRYAMFLLDNQDAIEKYCKKTIKERKKLCKIFKAAKYDVVSSEGNWIHVESKIELKHLLHKYNIHVKTAVTLPGRDLKYLRITVGPGVSKLFEELVQ
jgi:histidinol-phosphate aminotransferase